MNKPPRLPTTEDLQQTLRERCLSQAQFLYERMGEAIAALGEHNHLGALGALEGVEERTHELTIALKLIQDLSDRKQV